MKPGRQFLHPLLGSPGGSSSSLWAATGKEVVWSQDHKHCYCPALLFPRSSHTHPPPMASAGWSLTSRPQSSSQTWGVRWGAQDAGARNQALTVDQMTLGTPQSGCHILALFYFLIFFTGFVLTKLRFLWFVSQGFKAEEEVRTGVKRTPEGCWSLAPLQTAKCLMGAGGLMVDLREQTSAEVVCDSGCLLGRAKRICRRCHSLEIGLA